MLQHITPKFVTSASAMTPVQAVGLSFDELDGEESFTQIDARPGATFSLYALAVVVRILFFAAILSKIIAIGHW
ncbi:MAG: hypothetical protein R3E79_37225 [Caldilineaceae bacterium]